LCQPHRQLPVGFESTEKGIVAAGSLRSETRPQKPLDGWPASLELAGGCGL